MKVCVNVNSKFSSWLFTTSIMTTTQYGRSNKEVAFYSLSSSTYGIVGGRKSFADLKKYKFCNYT